MKVWLIAVTAVAQPLLPAPEENPDDFLIIDSGAGWCIVDQIPEFPGGQNALQRFLAQHVQYPPQAARAGVAGTVFVTFFVRQDGSICDVHVIKGVGSGCDEEAVRVISMMPDWKPAVLNKFPTPFRYTLPIKFSLTTHAKRNE